MSTDRNRFADILDVSAITALPEMNLPRIYNWLEQEDSSQFHPDPFKTRTVAEAIRANGIKHVRKIPRSHHHDGTPAPPFYGAQFILNCGAKLRVTYDIDSWIDFQQLILAFRTHDATTDSSRYHEQVLIARYNIQLNAKNVPNMEAERDKRLREVPYELHASIQAKYRERIQDAEILNMQLNTAFNSAQTLYLQSIHLDEYERESELQNGIER